MTAEQPSESQRSAQGLGEQGLAKQDGAGPLLSPSNGLNGSEASASAACQEYIYGFLLQIVKAWEPAAVLREFEQLFIEQAQVTEQDVLKAVHEVVLAGDRQSFFYTLKRCCFILINNWGSSRLYDPIHGLIDLLRSPSTRKFTHSRNLKRLRGWLVEFAESQEYRELEIFAQRYSDAHDRWSRRYMSYLLVPQYSDTRNPDEQRRAARALSKQLQARFRLDLAMYVAHSQARPSGSTTLGAAAARAQTKNPTTLGDNVLHLIKTIVLRRGRYSYENLAHIFHSQVAGSSYQDYKLALLKYMLFSVESPGFVKLLLQRLSRRLEELMPERNSDPVDEELVFLTNNRVIEFLTTEDEETPAPLFNLLISQGGPLTLVIVLLKLVLIVPKTRNRLEYSIAKLILHYEEYSTQDCDWFINFLEIFSVTFAIYVEDVQYNLVHVPVNSQAKGDQPQAESQEPRRPTLDDYRIFSQLKGSHEVLDKANRLEERLRQLAREADLRQKNLYHPDGDPPGERAGD
ncbi:MAG: hypothetical protein HC824_06455 [Synechococcales cyanobacterium RM1_1_8]|nr:hypothetical protein [Synechococcales cyanobacterium RM1_1_8]